MVVSGDENVVLFLFVTFHPDKKKDGLVADQHHTCHPDSGRYTKTNIYVTFTHSLKKNGARTDSIRIKRYVAARSTSTLGSDQRMEMDELEQAQGGGSSRRKVGLTEAATPLANF